MVQPIYLCSFVWISFGDLLITARQDRYALMCELITYATSHRTSYDYVRSGGGRLIPVTSNTESLKYICVSINFPDSWLKPQ